MARPQRASDEEIVARIAHHLGAREWPASSWSLAEVAPAAELSPAGLVKRFGSRTGLLRALGEHWVGTIPREPQLPDRPLEELRRFARDGFAAPTGAAAIAGLTDLLADLADDSTRAVLREGVERQLHYVARLVEHLALPRTGDPVRAAALLLDALHGGLVRRATEAGEGSPTPDNTIDAFLEWWT